MDTIEATKGSRYAVAQRNSLKEPSTIQLYGIHPKKNAIPLAEVTRATPEGSEIGS